MQHLHRGCSSTGWGRCTVIAACAKIKAPVFWVLWLLQLYFACGCTMQSMYAICHLSFCCRRQGSPRTVQDCDACGCGEAQQLTLGHVTYPATYE